MTLSEASARALLRYPLAIVVCKNAKVGAVSWSAVATLRAASLINFFKANFRFLHPDPPVYDDSNESIANANIVLVDIASATSGFMCF